MGLLTVGGCCLHLPDMPLGFMAAQRCMLSESPPCQLALVVSMDACTGAHHWTQAHWHSLYQSTGIHARDVPQAAVTFLCDSV